jgi:hypothetical protein
MKLNIAKQDIKEQQIKKVGCLEVSQHEHTGKWIYSYFIYLTNGKIIRLEPTTISLVNEDYIKGLIDDFPSQVIDGNSNLIGESIKSIIFHSIDLKEPTEDDIKLYGLLLSSGRVMANVYQAGGGSTLHVESLKGFLRHNPGVWKKEWSGIELS